MRSQKKKSLIILTLFCVFLLGCNENQISFLLGQKGFFINESVTDQIETEEEDPASNTVTTDSTEDTPKSLSNDSSPIIQYTINPLNGTSDTMPTREQNNRLTNLSTLVLNFPKTNSLRENSAIDTSKFQFGLNSLWPDGHDQTDIFQPQLRWTSLWPKGHHWNIESFNPQSEQTIIGSSALEPLDLKNNTQRTDQADTSLSSDINLEQFFGPESFFSESDIISYKTEDVYYLNEVTEDLEEYKNHPEVQRHIKMWEGEEDYKIDCGSEDNLSTISKNEMKDKIQNIFTNLSSYMEMKDSEKNWYFPTMHKIKMTPEIIYLMAVDSVFSTLGIKRHFPDTITRGVLDNFETIREIAFMDESSINDFNQVRELVTQRESSPLDPNEAVRRNFFLSILIMGFYSKKLMFLINDQALWPLLYYLSLDFDLNSINSSDSDGFNLTLEDVSSAVPSFNIEITPDNASTEIRNLTLREAYDAKLFPCEAFQYVFSFLALRRVSQESTHPND